MAIHILADSVASVSELKQNPVKTVQSAEGQPLAILNRNRPAFYCISVETWEEIVERLDDLELARIAEARAGAREIPVDLDEI
jgi:antitoxin StbD